MELHYPVSILLDPSDSGGENAVAKTHFLAQPHFPAWLYQALPGSVSQIPQEQHLHRPARRPLP